MGNCGSSGANTAVAPEQTDYAKKNDGVPLILKEYQHARENGEAGSDLGVGKIHADPHDGVFDPSEVKSATLLRRCLAIREKYVGPAVGPRVEPDTCTWIPKPEHRLDVHSTLALIDAEAKIGRAWDGGCHKIRWEPFEGVPPAADPSLNIAKEKGVFIARDLQGELIGDPGIGVDEFCRDYVEVLKAHRDRDCMSFCGPRLHELDVKYDLHVLRNSTREAKRQGLVSGRDWYQVRKVDTHIHHSACFTQRQLMQFIRKKVLNEHELDTVVHVEDGVGRTLREVLTRVGVHDSEDVTGDKLCCMASLGGEGQHETFGRFDRFNGKYNPFGNKLMRDIFLKTDNHIEGRYLAELTHDVMAAHKSMKFVCGEWRISIYGKDADEWRKLARWFRKYDIKCPQVRWVIQVPRLYALFRKLGAIKTFADMMGNVFGPLFEASANPAEHADIFFMLQQVVGFDSVDDESQTSEMTLKEYPSPEDWSAAENPPYTYWMYNMYANIRSLNALRRHRGLNTFQFRPHCGEAGHASHLVSGFMLTDGICHGVMLKESPVLQYLFYLAQVGLAVSPLSNDILFIPLAENPFGTFFKRGLNVSLSTDDPLIIHMTDEALLEEYTVAARTFRLSFCDLCEIARNSVLQSGFETMFKQWWVGKQDGDLGEEHESKSNVPDLRFRFRQSCHSTELEYVAMLSAAVPQE